MEVSEVSIFETINEPPPPPDEDPAETWIRTCLRLPVPPTKTCVYCHKNIRPVGSAISSESLLCKTKNEISRMFTHIKELDKRSSGLPSMAYYDLDEAYYCYDRACWLCFECWSSHVTHCRDILIPKKD
jgi:hypothetical protein